MKPAKIYDCETCCDSGYVRSACGALEPCPSCEWRAVALARSQSWDDPSVGEPETCGAVKSDAPPDKRWTPAQVGRALKIVLYVGVAAAVWVLNHYSGGKMTAEDRVLEAPDTPGPAAADDFSPWEPEP